MNITRRAALVTSALVLLVVAIIGAVLLLSQPKDSALDSPAPSSQQATSQAQNNNAVNYKGVTGRTALELLKEQASIGTKDSSYGVFVDSINGVQSGTDGKYWTFYVNGAMATSGADTYQTKDGEVIEWKFQ